MSIIKEFERICTFISFLFSDFFALISFVPLIYLFIWVFTSLSTLYRSYHYGELEGQRKPVHTVGQGSVL